MSLADTDTLVVSNRIDFGLNFDVSLGAVFLHSPAKKLGDSNVRTSNFKIC